MKLVEVSAMGYTHYYRFDDVEHPLNQSDFEAFTEDVKKIVDQCDVRLKTEIDGGEIYVNAWFKDERCEPFWLRRVYQLEDEPEDLQDFLFTKTRRFPYDKAVCAILIALKDRFPGVEISSDGSIDKTEGWKKGKALYCEALGKSLPRRFQSEFVSKG